MRKPEEWWLSILVRNAGRPDGTTRDTWVAVAGVKHPANIDGADVARGNGEGKRPEVAANRAVTEAFANLPRGR